MKITPKEKVLEYFLKVHGNKYKYDFKTYTKMSEKMKIICLEHGEFWQTPNGHKNGRGCPICRYISSSNKRVLNIETQIEHFQKTHENRYEYDWKTYINTITKMRIVCPIHGEFWQKPNNHKNGKGCPKCGDKIVKRLTFNEQLKSFNKVHNNKYQYDETTYVNNSTKMRMICPVHGEFFQCPGNHKGGVGCLKCYYEDISKSKILTPKQQLSEFKKIHNDEYEYDWSTYTNTTAKMNIICRIHGVFKQSPNVHKQGCGCPKCKSSSGEKEINKILNDKNIKFKEQKTFKDCIYKQRLRFDFYLPDYDTCIEFNGMQHYEFVEYWHKNQENFEIDKLKDKIKTEYCKSKGINLIVIPYWEQSNIEKILMEELIL